MSETSIYDYGLAAIPILETELLKERSEHQAFRAAVRDALAELRAQMEINANPEAAYWAVRLRATMTALGLGAEGEKR